MKYPISLAAVVAVVFGVAGCGSSSHTSTAAAHSSPPTSVAAVPVAATAAAVPSSSAAPSAAVVPSDGGVPSAAAVPSTQPSAGGQDSDSAFCKLARQIGRADLGVSSGNEDPDPHTLLGQVDRLDALAPSDLKHDFDVYASLEHSVLDPGGAAAPKVVGDTTAALEHVSAYFVSPCGVG